MLKLFPVSMPVLSQLARRKKLEFFLPKIPRDARVLEVGAGDGWMGGHLKERGWEYYTSVDCLPPADIVGDINEWGLLGLKPASVDVLIAFELVEHGDFYQAFHDLLKPGGLLLLTTPVPHMDWVLKSFELLGLNQKRTSPHSHLHYLKDLPGFESVLTKRVAQLAQWGMFRKIAF